MKFTSLYSGSKGNCYLIQSQESNVLVDCGLSLAMIKDRLAQMHLSFKCISAVFVTHEHTDHVSALPQLELFEKVPVFVHEKGARAVQEKTLCKNISTFDKTFQFRDLTVDTICCSHDAAYCCGYRFSDGTSAVGIVADTGCAPQEIVEFLAPCTTILLESNHDVDMLMGGPYPYKLKKRILSTLGHLSNKQAGEIVQQVMQTSHNVKNIVLGHISQNNNMPELAFYNVVTILENMGLHEGKDVKVAVALQDKRSATFE
ncbi:MAG: MBL fold metallo-hydrolase [Clostridia bacterium]|nr:MBL fold metallo-hydrolase [Clostridia bacterium]